jgi:hypothetical protein
MSWRTSRRKGEILTYTCLSTDTKLVSDPGSYLYEFNETTGERKVYQNKDGTNTGWVPTDSIVQVPIIIAAGATGLSAAVDLTGMQIMQIQMPATWITAELTVQTSDAEAGTYQDLVDDTGAEVVLPVVQGKNMAVTVNALALAGISWAKFRSGRSGAAINQTASRTIKIIGKI